MVCIDTHTGTEGIKMVAVHHHVCQCLTENLVLAFICCCETVILDVYRSINKGTETSQNDLYGLPDVLLFRDAVGVSYFRLLYCRCRNLYIVHTKGRHITQNKRRFPEHQKPGVS